MREDRALWMSSVIVVFSLKMSEKSHFFFTWKIHSLCMFSFRWMRLICTYHFLFPLNCLFLRNQKTWVLVCHCLFLRFLIPTIIPNFLSWPSGKLWDSWVPSCRAVLSLYKECCMSGNLAHPLLCAGVLHFNLCCTACVTSLHFSAYSLWELP